MVLETLWHECPTMSYVSWSFLGCFLDFWLVLLEGSRQTDKGIQTRGNRLQSIGRLQKVGIDVVRDPQGVVSLLISVDDGTESGSFRTFDRNRYVEVAKRKFCPEDRQHGHLLSLLHRSLVQYSSPFNLLWAVSMFGVSLVLLKHENWITEIRRCKVGLHRMCFFVSFSCTLKWCRFIFCDVFSCLVSCSLSSNTGADSKFVSKFGYADMEVWPLRVQSTRSNDGRRVNVEYQRCDNSV